MIAAAALAGAAAALAAAGVAELLAGRSAGRVTRPRPSGLRTGAVGALARLGRALGPLAPPRGLADRLAAAGLPARVAPGEVMALKLGAGLLATPAGVAIAALAPGRLGALVLPAAPLAGFLAPDAWLRARTRARGRAMAAELPDLLDLLRIAVEAGLPLERALAEVARRHPGPLARELRGTARALALGVPREAALTALVRRCPADGLAGAVAAIERAARHGGPLAATLAGQAAAARAARARRVREEAARAAPKIQLVVALLLVPAVLLLVAAALAAAFLGA